MFIISEYDIECQTFKSGVLLCMHRYIVVCILLVRGQGHCDTFHQSQSVVTSNYY